jgi:peptidoglycan/xylan/chitin deacetylase (PgdA/CDA1 family)
VIVLPSAPFVSAAQRLALKIDVRTYRGALHAVPRLLEVLRRHQAHATFLFALGPDGCGRTLLRAGARMLLGKLDGHALLSYYGVRSLLYGTVLPRPDIGRRCAEVMRRVRAQGFGVGLHAWDAASWQSMAATADAAWTRSQMERAVQRFERIFGSPARVHGAADWRMNKYAFRLSQRLGFDYGTDTRGTRPFLPVLDAELIACPQVPTTLPTLEELLARDQMPLERALDHLLMLSRIPAPEGHVYTLRAELEGTCLLGAFDRLLGAWRAQGLQLLDLDRYLEAAQVGTLPRHRIDYRRIDKRGAPVAMQGPAFLG